MVSMNVTEEFIALGGSAGVVQRSVAKNAENLLCRRSHRSRVGWLIDNECYVMFRRERRQARVESGIMALVACYAWMPDRGFVA